MPNRRYDAIIAGASFAGLAVARELRGAVLLIDPREVGSHQTSACGTPLWVPEALGLGDSVLQVHRRAIVHTQSRTVSFDIADAPYCTFDYRKFCQGLLDQAHARFLRAAVTGVSGDVVETTAGRFSAPCLVDCSGWRGVLATWAHGASPGRGQMSFGLEAEADYRGDALYFWANPARFPEGIAWLFPAGRESRVGLGSYRGQTKLKEPLDRFVADVAAAPTTYHGTYFPGGLRAATAGRIFVAGDAAGHCLPVTGEGIRPALYFGGLCGRIVQQVIGGTKALDQGLAEYRERVEEYRWAYRMLGLAQWIVKCMPSRWAGPLAAIAADPRVMGRWWPRYSRLGDQACRE